MIITKKINYCLKGTSLILTIWEISLLHGLIKPNEHFKSDSQLPKKIICFIESPLNRIKKCFLFHLKSSLRFQDIYVFIMTSWSTRKNALIKKTRLISKFMTSQPGHWTIAIYILSNISRIKGNQTMKQTFFFKITQKNETERLVPDLFFFKKKFSIWGKSIWSAT